MTRRIDLVADVGESFGDYTIGDDAAVLSVVTSANIACGFHAGDPRTMLAAVRRCVENGVAIGAHPGFPDLVGFGRRAMIVSHDELMTDVLYQVGALAAFARAAGGELTHVAPHGRLGNLAVTDAHYARGVADAVKAFDRSLVVLTQAGELEREARARELPVALLGFPDRAYEDDGNLVARSEPGAVLHDPDAIVERALEIALEGAVISRHGTRVAVECDSLLLHGDNAASIEAARRMRSALEARGVQVRPFRD